MPKEQYSGRPEGHQLAPVDPRLARHAMPADTARGVDRVSAADQHLLQIAGRSAQVQPKGYIESLRTNLRQVRVSHAEQYDK